MTISKAPLLMIMMIFGLQANVSSDNSSDIIATTSEDSRENMFNIARNLQKKDNPDAKIAGEWLEHQFFNSHKYDYFDATQCAIMVIFTNNKLDFNEKITYILKLKKQKENQRTQELKVKVKELIIFMTAIATVCTAFAPFIYAGAQIGDGFGKYIREYVWRELDVIRPVGIKN